MIKAIVAGIGGRMGNRIASLIAESRELSLAGAFEQAGHPAVGRDLGELLGLGTIGLKVTDSMEKAVGEGQVLIDFTFHKATLEHARQSADKGIPMVIGTTGFSKEDLEAIKTLSQKIPMVLSPNMSVGVNVLFKLVGEAARLLGEGYDMEILEAHHRLKKDAPSGTALRLAQILAENRDWKLEEVARYERRGLIGERPGREIGIQTWRAGDIVGEHTVLFCSNGERLEITHRAHSRDNFARGALRAAVWVAGKTPGFYDMGDVLGLREGASIR